MSDPAFKSAVELAGEIRAKRVGCVELLDHYIARVERHNPKINALVVEDFDRARKRAAAADAALARGQVWGPLHGVPMTIKESYNVAGLPTTWGVPGFANSIAAENAVAVDRMLDAGVVLFGKTNVPIHLADFQSYNDIYGTTGNPWDTDRTPGGSSGGSAAMLAAGLTGIEAGSDIGGSIRNPAHYCGVYGLKPTWGILPTRGQALTPAVSPPDVAVIGPLARSAEDLAVALDAMAGPDELDAPGWRLDLPAPKTSLADYRVAFWPDHSLCPIDTEVADRLVLAVEALAKAGAAIDDKARPAIEPRRAYHNYLQLMYGVMTARQPQADFDKALARAAGLSDDDDGLLAHRLRANVQYHRDWLAAHEARTEMRWVWAEFFRDFDVLVCPIAATTAFAHNHDRDMLGRMVEINGRQVSYFDQLFWAGIFGSALLPATIAPAGLGAVSGLPVGVQIVGPGLGDRTTIEFARLLAAEIGGFTPPPGYD